MLILFTRYVYQGSLKEEFLMCKKLGLTTTGRDVFEKADTFFTTEGLAWSSLYGVCTDVLWPC